MNAFFKVSALAAATAGLATVTPASAEPVFASQFHAPGEQSYNHSRERDGRYYCREQDGTAGLLIGGAAGALLGREIDGGRDRTVGTLLGAVSVALLGREIDRGGSRCR